MTLVYALGYILRLQRGKQIMPLGALLFKPKVIP